MIYKIEYEREQGGKVRQFVQIPAEQPISIELREHIFYHIHRYYGDHMSGHGDFTATCTKVSRMGDGAIMSEIDRLRNKIDKYLGEISELEQEMRNEYKEFDKIIIKSP